MSTVFILAFLGAVYPRPAEDHLNDFAGVLNSEGAASIRSTAQIVLRDRGVPIVVVTIPSLAAQGADGWSIERYANNLYNARGTGDGRPNRGRRSIAALP